MAQVSQYGFVVIRALVTDFMPARGVVDQMNNIYTQALQKQVTAVRASTQKMVQVIHAEAESECRELLGKGLSLMRRAYLHGIQECLDDFVKVSPSVCCGRRSFDPRSPQAVSSQTYVLTWEDVLYMQLLLQYFDSMKDINAKSTRPTLALSLDPKSVNILRARLNVGRVLDLKSPSKTISSQPNGKN